MDERGLVAGDAWLRGVDERGFGDAWLRGLVVGDAWLWGVDERGFGDAWLPGVGEFRISSVKGETGLEV